MTRAYYVQVLRKLRADLVKKRPGKLQHGIIFHHANSPAYSARVTKEVWELLPYLLYSPDLASSDFFYSQNLKNSRKASRLTALMKKNTQQKHCSQTGLQIFSKTV